MTLEPRSEKNKFNNKKKCNFSEFTRFDQIRGHKSWSGMPPTQTGEEVRCSENPNKRSCFFQLGLFCGWWHEQDKPMRGLREKEAPKDQIRAGFYLKKRKTHESTAHTVSVPVSTYFHGLSNWTKEINHWRSNIWGELCFVLFPQTINITNIAVTDD